MKKSPPPPHQQKKKPPQLNLPDIENIDDINKYSIDDFKLEGYEHHPPIKAKMAI